MNKHNRKFLFLMMIFAIVSVAFSAMPEASAQGHDNLEALQRYEERISSADLEIYHRYLDRAKKEWLGIYKNVWQSRRLDDALRRRTDAAVDAEVDRTTYVDRIRGIWDDKVVGQVLQRAAEESQERFGSNYRDFLSDLDAPYSEQLGKLLSDLARELSEVRRDAASSMPGYQALVNVSLNPAVADVQTRFEVPKTRTPLTIQNGTGLAVGVGVLALRKALQKGVIDNLVKRVVGSAGRKALFVVEGPLGWTIGVGLIAHDVYSIGRDIQDVPEKIKAGVYDSMKGLFYVQAAELAWTDGLKQQVEQQVRDVRDLVSGSFDASFREFRTCGSYQNLASGLDEREQNELLMKLYVLRSGTSMSLCRLSDQLGGVLLKVGTEQLNCIQKSVKTIGLDLTSQWLNLGYSRICDLTQLTPEQLARFEPGAENMDFLVWVSGLPEQQRSTASRLDRETAAWVRKLSLEKQIHLLRDKNAEQVMDEVNQLRSARQATDNGLLHQFRQGFDKFSESVFHWKEIRLIAAAMILLVGGILLFYVILILRRVISPLARLFHSRKSD